MEKTNKKVPFTDYLQALTDDVGIFQHSIYGIPDRSKGYTTDDNARALILAVMLLEKYKKRKYLDYVYKYLAFLLYAQNDNGRFKNFMNYEKEFLEEEGSEDCFGRCLWALGRTISSDMVPENMKKTCWHMVHKVTENWVELTSLRAKAYSIVGLSYVAEEPGVLGLIEKMTEFLMERYESSKDTKWFWFEDFMTYGNSFFPWALARAYQLFKKDNLLKTAEKTMGFLGQITSKGENFKPIGCNGWLQKGKEAAKYDEQPIEACESLLAYMEFYDITNDKKYLKNAEKCFQWYLGQNSKKIPLTDFTTGAIYDGLHEEGRNLNQGSESLVSYGIAYLKLSTYSDKETKKNSTKK